VLQRPLEAKRRLGYLPENPPVYSELTVRRYLRFIAQISTTAAEVWF
jgi:gliding motility-associated transport system ATP-binding protein